MKRSALFVVLVVAACTPMQWAKEDATPEQFSLDAQECQQHAWREASSRYWFYQPMAPMFVRDASGRGFVVWPSGSVVDPYGQQMLEENRLAQFCMESKGYRLVPAPKQ